MQEYNLQRDINASTERRFYTIEERMEKYEAKVDRIIYIQLATIILFIATSPQIIPFLKLFGV